MRRHTAVLAALALILAGCGSEAPVAQVPASSGSPTTTAPPASSAPPTTSTASSVPTRSTNPRPPAPPSSNVKDCFDADCTLLLTKPTTIPLDAKTFHYPSIRVTAISAESLTYSVTYPQGGGAQSTIGVGIGGGSFGFQGSPSVEVGLTLIDGKPALVLQPGAVP